MIKAMEMTETSDANLVAESLTGNRDAFGQIVARYQNLVCSLAYSATGSLNQSEDLAQETSKKKVIKRTRNIACSGSLS